jgi:hypothetical protein
MGIVTGLATSTAGGAAKPVTTTTTLALLERETGIEPASLAWKAKVLPLNYSRRESPHSPGTENHSGLSHASRQALLVEEAGFEPA